MENVSYNCTHARVSEAYIHLLLMHTTDHIFPVLPIKNLINKDRDLTTPFKLATGTEPSVSYLRMLLCPFEVRKATACIGKKALNVRHQAQKVFCYMSWNFKASKGYLVNAPGTRNIISSYHVVFDESFSSALSYISQPYAKAMTMRPTVSYTHYDTSSR